MAEETTKEYLERREKELEPKVIEAEAKASHLRDELIHVRRALAAISPSPDSLAAAYLSGSPVGPLSALQALSDANHFALGSGDLALNLPSAALRFASANSALSAFSPEDVSIKGLVTSAFKAHRPFTLYGATTQELRDFIKKTFDRDINRESLSPTLSRMRADDLLEGPDADGRWHTPKLGKSLYKDGS